MKSFLAFVAVSLLVAGAPLRGATTAEPAGELIDRVWAGHPVGFALLVDRGHQFIAYYDAERRLTIAGRPLGAREWKRVQPPGVRHPGKANDSNVTGWDSHNYLRLALDRDGCLHVSGNMHVDPLVYYRTRMPFNLATLERVDRMVGEREERCTYPVFFKDAEGELMFRYRDGSSGNGADIYNIYDVATRAWRRVLDTPLLDGEGKRNAYALDPILGPDGRFHLVWMWRDTPDCATNNTLSYARSRDFVHWENSRGQPLALPITLARGEVIDPAKPREGLINMTFNLGFDREKRPLVVYHRYDAQGRSQAYLARPNAGPRAADWQIQQISDWTFKWAFSGGGSIPAEVKLGAPRLERDGAVLVDFATEAAGAGRWRIDARTPKRIELLPAPPSALPEALARAGEGMQVQTATTGDGHRRWVLRWETLPRNRDLPRESAPPPTELRLYEFLDSDASNATHVGS